MQAVCLECHNKNFITNMYDDADKLTNQVNDLGENSNDVMKPLRDQKLITDTQFDEPIEFDNYDCGTIGVGQPNSAPGCRARITPSGTGPTRLSIALATL